jgi:hypothetical protein
MNEMRRRRLIVALGALFVTIVAARIASAQPCLIFVHGKRTNTDTYTNWNAARSYWQQGSSDFVRTATNNYTTSAYVIGYNGTKAYWDPQAAGEVANEIVNATNGGADGGGNHCARTYAEGGTFWVIAHSMGPTILDFILGNSDPDDPNYNLNGPYDLVAQRLTLAIAIAGTHRGSQLADNVCGGGNIFCQLAGLIEDCDTATYWIRSADDVQVRTYSNAPARNVYLTAGYAAIFGPSACLAGEDDGLVQYASTYACDGSASTGYNNSNVCNDGSKQESSGFHNLDAAHENHDEERNDSHRHTRQAIPTGLWTCGGAPCPAGTTVQSNLSTAQLVAMLYAVPTSAQLCQPGSSSPTGNAPCLYCFPGTFAANPGATSCAPCAAGTSASDSGATACAPCPAGTYAAADGAAACLACSANTFSTGAAAACTPCAFGTSAPPGSSTCTAGTTPTTTLPSGPCTPNVPCLNGGTCLATESGAYRCVCPPGISGQNCEIGGPPMTTTTSSTSSTTSTTSTTSSSSTTSSTSSSTTSSSTTSTTSPSTTTSTTLPAPPCGPSPATGCRLTPPGRSSLKIKDYANGRNQVTWKWNRGATGIEDFGDPVHSSATHRVCLYDASGNPQPLLEVDVPPAGTCGTKPCWRATTKSFVYRNRVGEPDGVIKLLLKAGLAGRAKVLAAAKGVNLQTPAMPLSLPVSAQLVIADGVSSQCWQTTFTTATVNDVSRLKAVGP